MTSVKIPTRCPFCHVSALEGSDSTEAWWTCGTSWFLDEPPTTETHRRDLCRQLQLAFELGQARAKVPSIDAMIRECGTEGSSSRPDLPIGEV